MASGSAAVGTLNAASRADHVHPSAGLYAVFGDGSDGAVVLDGTNTYPFLSKSGNVYTTMTSINARPFFATSLTVSGGVTLAHNAQFLFVMGTLTNAGTISCNGSNAIGATGGAGAINSFASPGLNGPNGGTGNGASGVSPGNPPLTMGTSGGAGGAGASGTAGAAGSGGLGVVGGSAYLLAHGGPQFSQGTFAYNLTTSYRWQGGPSGGAGGGDGTNSGGGGGGGGGILNIFAKTVINSGTIQANGGNGGTPTAGNCGGGGGGGSGQVTITTLSYTNTGAVQANGGAGGAGTGTGAAGSAGVNGTTSGMQIAVKVFA